LAEEKLVVARAAGWSCDPDGQPGFEFSRVIGRSRDSPLSKENKTGATVVSSYTYTVNALGQRTNLATAGTAFASSRTTAWGYDPLGQVTTAATSDSSADRAYQYDAIGNRISRSVGVPPTPSKTYIWGLDLSSSMQDAGGVGGLLAVQIQNPQSAIYYPTYDGNGNISEYLGSDSTIAAHFEYDPFGNTTANTDSGNQFAYRFSTKPLDAETGLYYYGYRFYDPVTGRWPSRDTIEEDGGLNLYGFVGNNGIGMVDCLGMKECDLVVVITLDKSAREVDGSTKGAVKRGIEKQLEFLQKMIDRCIDNKKCCCDSVKVVPKYKDGDLPDPDVTLDPGTEAGLPALLEGILKGTNGDFPVLVTGQTIGWSLMSSIKGYIRKRPNSRNPLGYTPQTGGIIVNAGSPATIAHELGHYLGYLNTKNPMVYNGKSDPRHTGEKETSWATILTRTFPILDM
jgi:RHS repeat-associated protein